MDERAKRLKELTAVREVAKISREIHKTFLKKAPLFNFEVPQDAARNWTNVPDKHRVLLMEIINDLIERGFIVAGPKSKGRVPVRKQRESVQGKGRKKPSSKTR